MSGKYHHSTYFLNTHFILNAWAQNSEMHSEVWILEFLGFSSGENKKREKQEKRRAHYKKNRRKIIQKALEAWKKSQEAKCARGRSLFFKGNSFSGNIIDQTYKLYEKVAAVLPGTVRYICGALTSKGKRWQIFQVPLNEHEQVLASLWLSYS